MEVPTLIFSLVVWSVSGQRLKFCNDKCLEPLNDISCEELILNYEFLGSCCSLVDIPASGGCRVEVGGPGKANCAWVPFCEPCDPDAGDKCGIEFQVDTDEACPDLDYDALAIQAAWEQPIESLPPVEGGTSMPTLYFAEPPSCAPTGPPVAPTPTVAPQSSASSAQVVVFLGVATVGAAYVTLF